MQYSNRNDVMEAGVVSRDRAMADNILWIQTHNSNSKLVLWAHNGHINNYAYDVVNGEFIDNMNGEYQRMGKFLKLKLKNKYFPVGLTTFEGTYDGGIIKFPPNNSFEFDINQLGMVFALSNLSDKKKMPYILPAPLNIRSIGDNGNEQQENQFELQNIGRDYDAMIYIKTTTPTIQLY